VQSNLTQNEPQPEPEQKVNADADDEKYKGWTDEEIAADKLRLEKAKKDAESAKLFASSSDVPNETVSWNIDVFNTNNTVNNVNNFSFEDGQRGIDLEAEAVLNKIKTDKSISFGVVTDNNETEPDFSNVTTRNVTSESSGLGMANFAFDGNNDNKPKDAQQVTTDTVSSWNISSNNEQETETSGWGSLGGGFSSVKTTEGFGNVQWGQSDDKNSGFGSFNTAETEQFDFGGLINDNAANQTQQTQGNEEEKVKETTNGQVDDEDNGNFTLKPIVDLEEVDVATGHEEDKELKSFDISKLYRWGKDVSGEPTWKNRATKTALEFYQNQSSGKIRIVARENVTNKLRLNQLVAPKGVLNMDRKSDKQITWSGFDMTIEEEDGDEKGGFCMFAAKFAEKEIADAFTAFIITCSENNESI